jgi:glycerol-3-phosphate dehydrogenase (NAD(P)+)
VLELARGHHVEMPITEGIVAVMHGGLSPVEAGRLLMSRTPKPERYGV